MRQQSPRHRSYLLLLLVPFVLLSCVQTGPPAGAGRPGERNEGSDGGAGILDETHKVYGHDPNVVKGGTANYRLGSDPETLNVLTSKSGSASNLQGFHLFPPLLEGDPDTLEPKPLVAEAMPEVSEDKLHYTFRIRKDVRWTDGKPLTAHDYKFTWDAIQDPGIDCAPTRAAFDKVKDLVVLDDYTIRFDMKEPYFRSIYTLGSFQPAPKHLMAYKDPKEFNESPQGRAPVGYGPYKLVKWETNKELIFERNDDYFLFRDPAYFRKHYNICRIRYKIINESKVVFELFSRGELDTVVLGPDDWEMRTNTPEFKEKAYRFEYYLTFMNYIGWNNRTPFFSDKRVRKAMTLLTQREAVLKNLLHGHGTIATCSFYVKSPEYSRDIVPLPYDPEQAKTLLEEAGWKDTDGDGVRDKEGRKFEFEILSTQAGDPWISAFQDTFKEDLRRAGIVMTIHPMEWAAFLERLYERKFDAAFLGVSTSATHGDPYGLWHTSQCEGRAQNRVCYSNPEVDRILDAARTEFDDAKRIEMYHGVNRIIYDDQPWTFLFAQPALVAVSKKFRNVQIHTMGTRDKEWFIPKELQTEDCGAPLPSGTSAR